MREWKLKKKKKDHTEKTGGKGSSMVKVIIAVKDVAYASFRYLQMCTHKQAVQVCFHQVKDTQRDCKVTKCDCLCSRKLNSSLDSMKCSSPLNGA